MKKIIIAALFICLFFIPSLIFGGEWEILENHLPEAISSGAKIIQLSDSTCAMLGYTNLVWIGGGNPPGDEDHTNHWAIVNLQNGQTVFQGQMLDKRSHFPGTEIKNCRLLLISGINENGEITSCEILDLCALVNSNFILSVYTDDVANASSHSDAITMKNGNVLYGGGLQSDANKWQVYVDNAGIWGPILYSAIGRHDFQLELDPLSDNVISIAGNPTYGEIEIFNPATEQWNLGPSIPNPVYDARTEVVSDSQIVLTGGYAWGNYFSQAVLYNTITNSITELTPFDLGRASHGAVWIEPLQSLFIGGGYTSISATKTCYSYHIPNSTWTDEGNLNRYQSWINFFLTDDYHIFAIGNHDGRNVELYTWNYAPFISAYTYSDGSVANLHITAQDPDDNNVSLKLFFIEDEDSTETEWTDFQASGYTFEFNHDWNSSTSSHTVFCQIRDQYQPDGVHNSMADSVLVVNYGVEPDPGYPESILMNITPHPVKNHAVIHFSLQHPSEVQINLYNAKGQWIENLLDERCLPSDYEINFNVEHLSRGMYFFKLETETQKFIKKMVLIN